MLLLMVVAITAIVAQTIQYTGTFDVDGYKRKNVVLAINANKTEAKCTFYKVKFSRFMPVTIDMTLEKLHCTNTSGKVSYSGKDIVPIVKNEPYENRKVKTFSAVADEKTISLIMWIGDKKVSYTGAKHK